MSARVWTSAELDRVHPLPAGWVWGFDDEIGWLAMDGAGARIYVDSIGRLCCDDIDGEDADVALAVILASKGLDSLEEMAVEVDREASLHVPDSLHHVANVWSVRGREVMARIAAMLRRGTVQP